MTLQIHFSASAGFRERRTTAAAAAAQPRFMMVQAATTEGEEEDETCDIEEKKKEKLVESVCVCVPGSQSNNQVKQPQHRGVRRLTICQLYVVTVTFTPMAAT